MVKFDPICADGASIGWNYISGARHGRKMVYRWWADQEFGTIFFHDHLFANYRQKHGLFGALLVEPAGSQFLHHIEPEPADRHRAPGPDRAPPRGQSNPTDPESRCGSASSASGSATSSRCGTGTDEPLNPPAEPGGHGDQGVMGLNYRNAPDPRTAGRPRLLVQLARPRRPGHDGLQDLRRRPGLDPPRAGLARGAAQLPGPRPALAAVPRADSTPPSATSRRSGISEAFTFINEARVRPGDYLYKLSGADDLWLGCWGLIRALRRGRTQATDGRALDLPTLDRAPGARAPRRTPQPAPERRFRVAAEQRSLAYRDKTSSTPSGWSIVSRRSTSPVGTWKAPGRARRLQP